MAGKSWWEGAVVYQIYPRSFQDSNGDGVGDLQGIIMRLDYISFLGIDAVWLCPFYPSPQADFGYDIADYYNVDPVYGSMNDFQELLRECHSREIRVIVDMVLNHTSNKHKWFLESRSSRDSQKRDWYIWKDGTGRWGMKPPNNWKSEFGGKAWTYDPETKQFYYHHFLSEQPDLNYRNPEVHEEVLNVLRFWLDLGVDGFRLDVIALLYEDEEFRNNPFCYRVFPSTEDACVLFQNHVYDRDQPETHGFIRKMRELLDGYTDRMMVGETSGPPEVVRQYYGEGDELHLSFNFAFTHAEFDALSYAKVIRRIDESLPTLWPAYTLSNHDVQRHYSRLGKKGEEDSRARIMATLLLALRGTVFLYYGEEIGMPQSRIRHEEVQDPVGRRFFGLYGRDGARTPMQWSSEKGAEFSTATPWLRLDSSYEHRNTQTQRDDPNSLLSWYRRLIRLRKRSSSLSRGTLQILDSSNSHVILIKRETDVESALVALNLKNRPVKASLPSDLVMKSWELSLTNNPTQMASLHENQLLAGLEASIWLSH